MQGHDEHRHPERSEQQERDVPVIGSHVDAGRHADDGRGRECRHQDSRRTPAALFREHVADDRQRQTADDPSKSSGEQPGDQQGQIAIGQPAKKRTQQEARVKGQERRLAAESVHD